MIELCDKNTCTQCFTCYNICPFHCISMEINEEGFKSPRIDYKKCVGCKLCVKSCHVLSPIEIMQGVSYPKVFAAWAKDNNIRELSSSGGLFSVIAKFILGQHGVIYGAAFSEHLKLSHKRVETEKELECLRESKYLLSDLEETFSLIKNDLCNGRIVLFVGTPCQVAGLKKYLKEDFRNLYTCDLVCHGVPSYKSFYSYLQQIFTEAELKNITGFHFRYTKGWGFQMSADFGNIRKYISPKDAFYLRAFNKGLMFMESCFKCRYSSPIRVGDITLGDFWEIGKVVPFRQKKHKGISLLLVNNLKGDFLFAQIGKEIFYETRNLQEAVAGNHNLHNPSIRPKERDTYIHDSFFISKKQLINKYGLASSLRDYLRPLKRWFMR